MWIQHMRFTGLMHSPHDSLMKNFVFKDNKFSILSAGFVLSQFTFAQYQPQQSPICFEKKKKHWIIHLSTNNSPFDLPFPPIKVWHPPSIFVAKLLNQQRAILMATNQLRNKKRGFFLVFICSIPLVVMVVVFERNFNLSWTQKFFFNNKKKQTKFRFHCFLRLHHGKWQHKIKTKQNKQLVRTDQMHEYYDLWKGKRRIVVTC